ncbi:peptide transporter family 1-like isoform X2 [Anthonomus grandis grandis]|uniref:peptide transporter family 1-like isoform X2 n=1 Tax=Anthonomus grandis grandis TaxID=2921223 RepID=UPI002166B534|nr:peptide transporter family 1-like isoform X2 [Anthonomus grandis grandis]
MIDKEKQLKKLPYPKSVFFIVSNEFCERFSYYGMRTILILYLTDILRYTESTAKILYHTFTMFVYFFPLIGAIVSDSWLGKFRTILYVSMIYACGSILLALTAVDPLQIPQEPFTIVALLLIAVGTGGIKPCVAAFGGDQFVLPQQEFQLATFFSLFYFSINAGSLISTFLTPILRNDVECFDNSSCYPLAFAVPGVLMVISIAIFAVGKPLYKIKKPKGNVFVNVVQCMSYAVKNRKNGPPVDHWLDRSESEYGAKLVSDIKALLKVLLLYIPLPIFWALYDQQGSGWTFQAVRMDGNIGFYTILPDQMQVVNPLLILAFIPLFTYIIYPLLAKCHLLKTPLQRMCCGGFLAAAAFAVSACVSIALESTYPVLPSSGEAQIRIYDTTSCNYQFTRDGNNVGTLTDGYYEDKYLSISSKTQLVNFAFTSSACENYDVPLTMTEATAYGIFLHDKGAETYVDSVTKSEDGYPLVRTLVSDKSAVNYSYSDGDHNLMVEAGNFTIKKLSYVGTYTIDILDGKEVEFKLGGTYTVLINAKEKTMSSIIVTQPNSVHILWLLPQYFIITAAEIMFSITGLEFSYSQAPVSMKSVLQACFLLTTAIGNLIIVLIESASIFTLQSNDFFLYTGLMVGDMLIFMWLAVRYKYVSDEDSSIAEDTVLEPDNKKSTNGGLDNPSFEKSN